MNTIGFADYLGNHQCITISNLADNPETFLPATDYAHRRRVKIWGRARVVENDAALERHLMPDGVEGHPEVAILFEIHAGTRSVRGTTPRSLTLIRWRWRALNAMPRSLD
jgi:predicted pyridoxine 5'-phosphate oxidase superfamily flavin-nucleotide-binding protein